MIELLSGIKKIFNNSISGILGNIRHEIGSCDIAPLPDDISCKNPEKKEYKWKPVNDQPKDTSRDVLIRDAEYAIQVATNYIRLLPCGASYLSDKVVLEIGAGINFGSSLIFSCYGAHVMVSDKYLPPWDEKYHPAFYDTLKNLLKKRYPGINLKIFDSIIANNAYSGDAIICHNTSAEDMSCIPDSSVDIIFSNAVLEHLNDLKKAFYHMFRITKCGGLGFHQVDFRDHRDMSRPLEFLLMRDKDFSRMFEEKCGECGNRYRYDEVQDFIEKTGFTIVEFVQSHFVDGTYLNDFILGLKNSEGSKYRDYSLEKLKVDGGHFHLLKK